MGRQKRAYQSVTIRDVAERAGVAVSTVSRVLNGLDRVSEETRRRVEQAARELSYVPNNFAASMVTGQSKILGIIVPPVRQRMRNRQNYGKFLCFFIMACYNESAE